jgi:hypothetical protein
MPYCPFCQRNHSSKRGEHVIPRWVSREFPTDTWHMEDRLTKYVRKTKKYIHLVSPMPCQRCNNTWLSRIENDAKPILAPLMHGKRSSLEPRDQVIIARWVFKTALIYDLLAEQQAPRPRYFDDEEYVTFREDLSFRPSYIFFIGAYRGSQVSIIQEDHSGVSVATVEDLKPIDGPPIRAYSLTLVINYLVLQIFCAKIDPAIGKFYMRDFRPVSTQIAISAKNVSWPPPYCLDDTNIDRFIHRWSDMPPPR